MAWNTIQSFHACSGWLATSADSLAIASGCQAVIDGCSPRPAAAKYASQSRPGALRVKSSRLQVRALCASEVSTIEACALALFSSTAKLDFALASASAPPAWVSNADMEDM